MSKRTLTALGAVLGSLLLVLGTQQAYVATSAAWTDQVSYRASASSGTWATALGKLAFTDKRFEGSGTTAVLRYITNVEHVYSTSNTPQAIADLTVTVSLPSSVFAGSPANPTAAGQWAFVSSVKQGSEWLFTFTFTGSPLGLNATTGLLTMDFPVHCNSAKGKQISMPVTATSPQAVASVSITPAPSTTLPNWSC